MTLASPSEASVAKVIPTTPPSDDRATASIRNCSKTSRSSAPIASRMPISRVRSVTDTSMIFMMPMPPTSRLTAATAPSSMVNTLVVPVMASAICRVSRMEKLSSSLATILRRSRISNRKSAMMRSVSPLSCADTIRVLTSWLPVRRRCRVRSGITMMSS